MITQAFLNLKLHFPSSPSSNTRIPLVNSSLRNKVWPLDVRLSLSLSSAGRVRVQVQGEEEGAKEGGAQKLEGEGRNQSDSCCLPPFLCWWNQYGRDWVRGGEFWVKGCFCQKMFLLTHPFLNLICVSSPFHMAESQQKIHFLVIRDDPLGIDKPAHRNGWHLSEVIW